jgi:hypothetical protein
MRYLAMLRDRNGTRQHQRDAAKPVRTQYIQGVFGTYLTPVWLCAARWPVVP